MKVLTKSRFKLGLECPNKLYYTRKAEYANQKVEDPFLAALAQGGFQVEELARLHYPGGVLIEGHDGDYEYLWQKTQELLQEENIVIFEAAFLHDGLFVRTDILVKKGNFIELIEVKAKSYDPADEHLFIGKRGGLVTGWKPYLFDIAFQKHVLQQCYPAWQISAYMMLANKAAKASVDGLNQFFRISKNTEKRTGILPHQHTMATVGAPILGLLPVSDIVQNIENNTYKYHDNLGFVESINLLKKLYQNDEYANWPTEFGACKHCEFKTIEADETSNLKSGYKECFTKQHQWTAADFQKPTTFEVWNFRKGEKLFAEGAIFMEQLTAEMMDVEVKADVLSTSERQWLQVEKRLENDDSLYVNTDGLRAELDKWQFPLHFIDFETSAVALPFNAQRRPYEQVAFQFSHHCYHSDGSITHASQYINTAAGVFPNFDFVRKLSQALGQDQGTILRYSNHENSILNAIYLQLHNSNEPDKAELMAFIESISHSTKDSATKWRGDRDMVDLWDVVKKYYYNPLTQGSNSIKYVLPAVLQSSAYLQAKYAQPLSAIGVSSHNFSAAHVWLQVADGKVQNPYKMLPPVFAEWTDEQIANTLSDIEEIANGGAALTAYGKLQYTDMSQAEKDELCQALLKYCELDTLAMVMIYEHFKYDLG